MTVRRHVGAGPSTDDREVLSALRAALHEHGYTPERIAAGLATEEAFSRDTDERPLYVRMLPPGEPFSALVELFLLGLPVPRAEAERALAALPLERLADAGVLELEGDTVVGAVELVPVRHLLVASDPSQEHRMPDQADFVAGPTPPTTVLANLTVRRPVDAALDLGTGSGIQALLAAEHSGRVVATDLNERALRYAEFNAALNGIDNVTFRSGSLFEPVQRETFDLIVANPPYLISPETDYLFRDSGLPGDSFCEALVREVGGYLNEGGHAQLLAEWAHAADEPWDAPLRRWVAGSGCDALLLHYVSRDPLRHAAEWNDRLRSDPRAYAAALDRWVEYCRGLGIERIGWGTIALRRRTGRNWIWAETPSASRMEPAGHHLERIVAAQDLLSAFRDDGELLERSFALAPDHRLDQTLRLQQGSGFVEQAVLRLDGGLRFQVEMDAVATRVLSNVEPGVPLRDVIARVAAQAPEPLDQEEFAAALLPAFRRLVELGFLVPDGSRDAA